MDLGLFLFFGQLNLSLSVEAKVGADLRAPIFFVLDLILFLLSGRARSPRLAILSK